MASSSKTARPARAGSGSSVAVEVGIPSRDIKSRCPARRPRRSSRATARTCLAVLHARLSVRDGEGRGRGRRRRGRQRVPRLRGRHRGDQHRPRASRRRRAPSRAGAEVPAHVRHGLLLRAAGAAGRGDGRDRAGRWRSGEVRSFFSNSGTEANEAALKLARYTTKRVQHHRVPRVVPRPHAWRRWRRRRASTSSAAASGR